MSKSRGGLPGRTKRARHFPFLPWWAVVTSALGATVLSGGASQVAQWVESLPAMQGTQEILVQSLSRGVGVGRSPGGGHGNLLQYSCLENPMDRGAWRSVVYGVAESWTEHTRTRSVDWGKRYLGFVSVSLLIQGKPALFNSARTFWGARKPYFRGVSNVKKYHPYF